MGASQKIVVWATTRIKNLFNQISFASITILICGAVISSQVYAQGTDASATELGTTNNLPEISITGGEAVIEGEDAIFTITSSRILSEDLVVGLNVVTTSNQYISGSSTEYNSATIIAGTSSVQHIVATDDDNVEELTGQITLTLQSSTNFTLAAQNTSASVQVFDNDPVVWITAGATITEGSNAIFTVHTAVAVQSNKVIQVAVSGEDDFVLGTTPTSVQILAGATTGSLSIPTEDDQVDEFDGIISAMLEDDTNSSATYSIVPYSSGKLVASIVVRDNDAPVAIPPIYPLISIAANDTSIEEGEDARFTIVAKDSDTGQRVSGYGFDRRVYVMVTDGPSNFLSYQVSTRNTYVAQIPSGSSSGTLIIPTLDDKLSEDDGTIKVVILDGEGYGVASSNTASIQIEDNDDDTPVISLVQVDRGGGIYEGQRIRYELHTTSIPSQVLKVKILRSQEGDFLRKEGIKKVRVSQSKLVRSNTPELQYVRRAGIGTIDDQIDEPHGMVTLTLQPGTGYRVDKTANSFTAVILDNDRPKPTFRVEAVNSSISEGETAEFKVISNESIGEVFYINYQVQSAVSGTFENFSSSLVQTRSVRFDPVEIKRTTKISNPSTEEKIFRFSSIDDQLVLRNSSLTFTLLSRQDGSYNISTASATVNVIDNDDSFDQGFPIVAISPSPIYDLDGDVVTFLIYSTRAPESDLNVKVSSHLYRSVYNDSASVYIYGTIKAGSLAGTVSYFRGLYASDRYGSDEKLRVNIVNGTGYNIASKPNNSAEVSLRRQNIPANISVAALRSTFYSESGDEFKFQILSSTASDNPRTVNIEVSDGGANLIAGTPPTTVSLAAGETSAIVSIPWVSNLVQDQLKGKVTLTVLSGEDYSVAESPYNSDYAYISWSYLEPETVIGLGKFQYERYVEGEVLYGAIKASGRLNEIGNFPFPVKLKFENIVGSFLTAKTVDYNIIGNLFRIPISDDEIAGNNGKIKISILPSDDYQIYSGLESKTLTIVDNDTLGQVWIERLSAPIISEGRNEAAWFLLNYSRSLENYAPAELEISGATNFIENYSATAQNYTSSQNTSNNLISYVRVPIDDDYINEPDGDLTVSIRPSTKYTVDASKGSATVRVTDNDVRKVLSISAVHTGPLPEGHPAQFRITEARGISFGVSTPIRIRVTETADVIRGSSGETAVEIPSFQMPYIFNVNTINDDIDEADSTITVTLLPDDNQNIQYVLDNDSRRQTASVTITDNDELQIYELFVDIPNFTGYVYESQPVQLLLFSETRSSEATTIRLNVSQTGNVLTGNAGVRTVVIPAEEGILEFQIDTQDNNTLETDGEIEVTILPDNKPVPTYKVTIIPERQSVKSRVLDDDKPVISIAPVPGVIATEGQPAQFRLTASKVSSTSVTVRLDVTQQGEVLSGEAGVITAVIPAGETTKIIKIGTEADIVYESGGEVRVKLLEDNNVTPTYRRSLNSSEQVATFAVVDDDDMPVFSIEAVNNTVIESENAQFRLTAPNALPRRSYVRVYVVGSEIIGSRAHMSVIIPAYENEKIFSISTQDDLIHEPNGMVRASVLSDDRTPIVYGITSETTSQSATVVVQDNDALPVFSISAVNDSVEESSPPQFKLTSPTASSSRIGVRVVVSEQGDVLHDPTRRLRTNRTWYVPHSTRTKVFQVGVEDDEVDEEDGVITVSLVADNNSPVTYNVSSVVANQSAEVTVTDNDEPVGLPEVSISTTTPTIRERDTADLSAKVKFEINQIAPTNGLRVSYSIDETGDYLNKFIAGTNQVTIPAGSTSKEVSFHIINDSLDEPDGSFTVSLNTDSAYELGDQDSVTITIQDDDASPTMTITGAWAVYDSQGAVVKFTIRNSTQFVGTKTINVAVTGVTRTVTGRVVPSTVVMEGLSSRYTQGRANYAQLYVPIHEDQINGQTGRITATILAPTNPSDYFVGTPSSLHLNVSDFDSPTSSLPLPTISVTAFADQVGVDDDYFYIFKASHASNKPLKISYHYALNPLIGDQQKHWTTTSFTLPTGAITQEISIDPQSSQNTFTTLEMGGDSEIILASGAGYVIADSPNDRAFIEVNRHQPTAGISIVGGDVERVGGTATFQITAPTAIQSDRVINVRASAGATGLIPETGPSKIVLPANQTRTIFNVPTIYSTNDGPDFDITATILPGDGYTVSSTQSTATVRIFKFGTLPKLYLPINESPGSVTGMWYEGETESIRPLVVGSPVPAGVVVQYRVSDGGGNLYNGAATRSVTFDGSSWPQPLQIETNDDTISEDNGTITVEILPGSGYTISPTHRRVTYTVHDDDGVNEISIQPIESEITEGEYAQFRFTASAEKRQAYGVHFTYSQGQSDFIAASPRGYFGAFIYSTNETGLVIVGSSMFSGIVRIPTFDDNLDEANGQVTLSLVLAPAPETFYSLSSDSAKNSASVTVLDNDEPVPEISLSKSISSIVEGQSATFTLTSDRVIQAGGLVVGYLITQTGDFFAPDGNPSFVATIPAGATTKDFTITTHDDSMDEPNGSFTVHLASSFLYNDVVVQYTYRFGSPETQTVNVVDNDAAPDITIADATAVVEGIDTHAIFTLTASHAVSVPRTINVSIGGSTGFIPSGQIPTTVTLPALRTTATLNVPIHDDTAYEADGTISVTISAPTNTGDYQIGTPSSAQVNVTDDDYLISVSSTTDTIVEGETATFTFVANRVAPTGGLVIRYQEQLSRRFVQTLDEIRQFNRISYPDIVRQPTVTIPAGADSVSIEFASIDNDIDDLEGRFNITILEDSAYSVGTENSETVSVSDNDDIPTITISGGGTFDEGTEFPEFTFNASRMVSYSIFERDLRIRMRLFGPNMRYETDNYIDDVRFPPYQLQVVKRLSIVDDQYVGYNVPITAEIIEGRKPNLYRIGTPKVAQVTIADDDILSVQLPEISVSTIYPVVEQGEDIVYKIEVSEDFDTDITLKYKFRVSIDDNRWCCWTPDRNITLVAGETVFYHTEKIGVFDNNIASDDFGKMDGSTRFMILPGAGYQIAPIPNDRVTVAIKRYEAPTGISIVANSASKEEWEKVKFQLTAADSSDVDRVINIDVTSGTSNNFVIGTKRLTITIPAGKTIAKFDVAIEDDNDVEQDEYVTATIRAGVGYTVAATMNSARVLVLDDDAETPVIRLIDAGYYSQWNNIANWIEGNQRRFLLLSSHASRSDVESSEIIVTVKAVEDGGGSNFLSGPVTKQVSLESYDYVDFAVPDDVIAEESGSITVSLQSGTGYEISPTQHSVTLEIFDDDGVNELSISSLDATVTEGQLARFKINSSEKRDTEFQVHINISELEGDFIDGRPATTILMPRGQNSRTLYVPTNDDNIDEVDGRIQVTLVDHADYQGTNNTDSITILDSSKTATVGVLDNDTNANQGVELSIVRANSSQNSVEEGNDLLFTVSSSAPIVGSLVVDVTISQTNSNSLIDAEFVTGALTRQVTFANGSSSVPLTISTENDRIDEPNGQVTVSLVASTNYQIKQSAASATIGVDDEDIFPIIHLTYVSNQSTSVNESGPAQFRLRAVRASSLPITVRINVSQTGNVLAGSEGDTTIVIPAKELIKIFEIATDDDEIFEIDGTITVRLLDDDSLPATYTVSSNPERQSRTVQVLDNDTPLLPVVAISPVTSSVVESNKALFRVTRTNVLSSAISVRYNGAISDGIFDGVSQNTGITIARDASEAILKVNTTDDEIREPDSIITITLLADDNSPARYVLTPDSSQQSAQVTVIDDDPLPKIGVATTMEATTELVSPRFRLWTTTVSSDPITVRFNVSQTGNYLSGAAGDRTTILPQMHSQTYFEIATENDEVLEDFGTITVTILADDQTPTTYALATSTDDQSAMVHVIDDDSPPTVSIADATAVVEGTDTWAFFPISLNIADFNSRQINISVTGATNFIRPDLIPTTLTFPRYSLRKNLVIPIEDDKIEELDGIITVTITAPTNVDDYQIGTAGSAQVSVSDNDNVTPTISIADGDAVVEGTDANAVFELTSSHAVLESRTINISISGATNFIQSGQIPTSVTLPSLSMSAELRIPIEDDEVEEDDGTITVAISNPTTVNDYQVGTSSSGQVSVSDDEEPTGPPIVNISTTMTSITEGTRVPVKITLDRRAPAGGLRLTYILNRTNNGYRRVHTTVIRAGSESKTLYFQPNDQIYVPNWELTLSLVESSLYTLGDNSSVTVNVVDSSQPPAITLTDAIAVYDQDGLFAEFSLASSRNFNGVKTINVSVAGVTGDNIPNSVDMSVSSGYFCFNNACDPKETVLRVPIDQDSLTDENDVVTATILAPSNSNDYQVGTPSTIDLDLSDYDVPTTPRPIISIKALKKLVYGADEWFIVITSSRALDTPLTINVRSLGMRATNPDYSIRRGSTITLPAGETMIEIDHWTRLSYLAFDRQFEMEIRRGAGYQVAPSPDNYVKIVFRQYDEPSGISIVASEYILESWYVENVKFQITASSSFPTDRVINIEVNDEDRGLIKFAERTGVILPAGENTTFFEVPIIDDDVVESDRYITARILPGTDYQVATTKNSATIKVLDDDGVPIVYLPPLNFSDPWIEGESKEISARNRNHDDKKSNNVANGTIIKYRITDGGSNLYTGDEIRTAVWHRGSADIEIETLDDDIVEEDGIITIEILPSAGYQVSSTFGRLEYDVFDDDEANEILVEPIQSTITEGDYAEFRFTPSAKRGWYYVSFAFDDGDGDFLANLPSLSQSHIYYQDDLKGNITFHSWHTTRIVRIATVDDNIDEADGQITLTLIPILNADVSYQDYTLYSDPARNSTSITVLDNDNSQPLPVLSIAPVVTSVDESDPAQFRITSSVAATSQLAVKINVSQTGNVLAGTSGVRTVIISPTSSVATLEIDTEDDRISEPDGVISVSLVADTPATYTITPVTTNQSAQVTVMDDEPLPEFGIAGATAAKLEPDAARFRLWTSTASSAPVAVRINVSQTGNVLAGIAGDTTTIMPAEERQTYFEIAVEDDGVAEDNGSITVSLLADNNTPNTYTLTTRTYRHSATVEVYDDDTTPTITIADATAVVEGTDANATFAITTSHPVRDTRTVNIAVSGATSFIESGQVPTSVTLTRLSLRTALQIPIEDDEIDEADGIITVTISGPTNAGDYQVGSDGSAEVSVTDNDESPLPVFSIEFVTATVDESDPAQFRLTASKASSAPITVRYNVGKSGDVLDMPIGDSSVVVEANALEKIIDIPTKSNHFSENDGYILVALLEDNQTPATYSIVHERANQFAQVKIMDDEDLPDFGIAGATAATLEPDTARFRLWTTTASAYPVTVRINVSQTGDVLSGSAGETTTIMPAKERQTYFEIAVEDDGVAEDNGSITVSLLADNNTPNTYTLTTRTYRHSATVEVYDDDTTPTITIANATAVVEGTDANATFAITTSHPVRDTRTVNIAVSGATSFIESGQIPTSVTLTRMSLRTALQIPIEDDGIDEADGVITVTISNPTNAGDYQIGTEGSAQVSVSDNDDTNDTTPTISISDATPVIEGTHANAVFTITSSEPVRNSRQINIAVSGAVNYIPTDLIPTTVTLEPNTLSTTLSIPIEDDDIKEPYAIITVHISFPTNINDYTIGTRSRGEVIVTDNDPTGPSLVRDLPIASLTTNAGYIEEGERIPARIAITKAAPANGLVIRYRKSQVGDFFATTFYGLDSVRIPAGETFKNLRFLTQDDDIVEANGSVSLSLEHGPGYTVGSEKSVSLEMLDNDSVPRVRVYSNGVYYTEGSHSRARVNLVANQVVSQDTRINIRVLGATNFIPEDQIPTIATISVNSSRAVLEIPIEDDDVDEDDGRIVVMIERPSSTDNYKIKGIGQTSFLVRDNDAPAETAPEVSVSTVSDFVSGSDGYLFRITASHASDTDIFVNVEVKEKRIIAGFGNPASELRLRLDAGTTVYDLELYSGRRSSQVSTIDVDNFAELTIKPGVGYRVASSPRDKARIDSIRFDAPPGISIIAGRTELFESHGGFPVAFQITASSASQSDRIINVEVSDGNSDFIEAEGRQEVRLPSGRISAMLRFALIDDDLDESDGYVTATVLPGEGYTVATTNNTARIKIMDNDGLPIVYLSPHLNDSSKWIEGESRFIGVYSSSKLFDGDSILLRITDNGGNLYTGDEYVGKLGGDSLYHTFEIETQDDNIVESDGTITVEIMQRANHSIAPGYGRATFTVYDDDDVNQLTVEALESTITEGQFAQFRLTSSTPRNQSYQINFAYSQGEGDFIGEIFQGDTGYSNRIRYNLSESTGKLSFYSPGMHSRIIRIPTMDDNEDEADGQISLELLTASKSTSYTLSADSSKNTATVRVLDNDVAPASPLPVVTISASATTVNEGETVTIRFTSDQEAPPGGLFVHYQYKSSGNSSPISIPQGYSSTTVLNASRDDNIDEPDISYTVELLENENYTLGATSSVTINVLDDDDPPVINIADASAVVEGTDASAVFTLTATHPASDARVINISVTGATGFIPTDQIPTTATLNANSLTATLTIPIEDDEVDEADGIISVTMLAPTNTNEYLIGSPSSAQVSVSDNDVAPTTPLPVITISASATTVNEGETVTIRFSSDQEAPPGGLFVHYQYKSSGNSSPISIPEGYSSTTVLNASRDDNIDEPDISYTVELLENENYTLGETSSVTINVLDDDDPPVINITDASAVVEGTDASAVFTLTATHPASDARVINVSVTGATGFIPTDQIPTTATLNANSLTATLTIPIEDDEVDEADGIISVTMLSPTNTNEYLIGSPSSAQVSVSDDDDVQIPIISITTSTESVDEGDSFELVVNSTVPIDYPLVVDINLVQTNTVEAVRAEFIAGSNRQLFFANGSVSESVSISIIDDNVDEPNGTILASLATNSRYELGQNSSVSVAIVDNDKPVASMRVAAEANQIVPEGQLLHFGVILDRISWQPIEVNVNVSQSSNGGDFINPDDAGNSIVRVDNGERVGRFTVRTIEDDLGEENAEITATILSGDNYTVHNSASSTNPRESHSATVRVTDNDETRPIVSISRVNDSIQEGEEASFLVRIVNAISNDLDVRVQISSEIGALVESQYLENIVKISANETTQLLTIPTQGNDLDGPDSKVTATLQADERYLLPTTESAQSASITVLDDDVPLISIVAESNSIGEGAIARFGITTEVGVVEALSVSVVVNQTGDVISGGSGIETVHFDVGDTSKVLAVQTSEDEIDEIDGRITATIIEPNDGKYEISGSASTSIDVTDNDDPMIAIAPLVDRPITEGEVVQFSLTAKDREVDADIRININVTQSSKFMTWRVPRVIFLPAGKKITTLVISTIDDNKVQEDGEFEAEILAGEGYRISSQSNAKVAIEDNDTETDTPTSTNEPRISVADKIMNSLLESVGINLEPEVTKPEISIVARNDEVAEGEVIRFAIQASIAPEANLEIEISIDSPNDSISESTPMRVIMQSGNDILILELTTLDDNKLEEEEVITLTINEQPTYTISESAGSASVTLTDHKDWQRHTEIARSNGVVIPELAGRLSAQSLNQITERIQQGFASDGKNVLQIAGSEELTGILEQSGDAINNDALLKDTLFNNSSFAFSLLPNSTGFGSATTWGSGNQLEFQSQGIGNSAMSGEMLSSHLGLDVAFNEELISGFTGTYSDTQVEYSALDRTYEYDVQMTGLFPYIGWQNTDRADYLRVVTGLGSGEIGIRQAGNNWDKLTSSLYTTEISGGLQVYADNDASDHAIRALSLDSGIRTLRYFTEQESDVIGHFDYRQSQSHLTLEGRYAKDLSNGIELIPTAAIGLQGLRGNVTNEFGYILESGISVENPVGWTISGLGRTFFNSDDWSNDSQLQSTLAFDTNNDDLGTIIDITSAWGVASANETDSMWERHIFTRDSSTQIENSQTQISTEFGYGFGILDGSGILTPYNKIDWSDTNQQTIEFGSRVAVGAGISFELKGSRENRVNDEIDHQINFSGSFGW